jgi:hypothetical protein
VLGGRWSCSPPSIRGSCARRRRHPAASRTCGPDADDRDPDDTELGDPEPDISGPENAELDGNWPHYPQPHEPGPDGTELRDPEPGLDHLSADQPPRRPDLPARSGQADGERPAPPHEVDRPGPDGTPGLWFEPYAAEPRGTRRVLDQLPTPRAVAQVRAVILDVLAAEGPVHADRLTRLVARSFGLSRVVEDRSRAILEAVPAELWDADGEPFVWPPGVVRSTWSGFRRQRTTAERPLEHISLQEIQNAMVTVVHDAAGMSDADLLHDTNEVFGGTRLSAALRARLHTAKAAALASGRLQQTDDLMVAVVPEPPSGQRPR